ncbi:MAG: thioredoxin family protein [Micavibrio sp.]|nr:thioredoxin family protein [Micavibrio sp.]
MIKHLILAFCAFIMAAPAMAATPQIGEKAPNFTVVNSNGQNVSLSDFEGKVVVLEWTNHGCPYVQKHYETHNMQGLQRKYRDQDVIWLSIISSAEGRQGHVTGEQANTLTKERKASPSAVLLDSDGTVGKLYGASTTPHMFVINKAGTLVYKGAIDDNNSANHATVQGARNYVSEALDSVLAGNNVVVTQTNPYGCAVKYK